MNPIIEHLKRCNKNKVIIYPEYTYKDEYFKNVIQYKKNYWYLVINHNGTIIKLKKPIGVGKILHGKNISDPWEKTIIFYSNKLKKKGL